MSQIRAVPDAQRRAFATESLETDLVVVGGGMAGTCCAITAARAGASVVLIQDRPVLGGNASSEVRLWIVGAANSGAGNNRWAREGGVIDEILVENTYRNPGGNPVIFDTLLLEKVIEEPNITLLLNTVVMDMEKQGDRISSVQAFCSQNSTLYRVAAPLYCDASGDGVLGFLSGAAYRMGAESAEEFGEGFAPSEEYGGLLGHTIFFYTKDVGRPVAFTPPSYARDDLAQIARHRSVSTSLQGCLLNWIEYGGRLDTVHDTEKIKWELWRIVYGVWNHLKNSGEHPDAETLTLEWVGLIPGKRESRRFEGLYMLRQQDVVEQVEHDDAVAYGGWPIDLHPADGIFSEHPSESFIWLRGAYQIPYRCLVSRSVPNLFLSGRLISASHVAFGSTRVMATCAHVGQAVGMAAAICARETLEPAELGTPERLPVLRKELLRTGHHIPGVALNDPADLVQQAEIHASSEFVLDELPPDGRTIPLDHSRAQLVPVAPGDLPGVTFTVDVARPTTLLTEVRISDRPDNHVPSVVLGTSEIHLESGAAQRVSVAVDASVDEACYAFYTLKQNDDVAVRTSELRVTGLLSIFHRATQEPDEAIGRPHVELWSPLGGPYWLPTAQPIHGENLAVTVAPPTRVFGSGNIRNGFARPTSGPNAWLAALDDRSPSISLRWPDRKLIREICLSFDNDFDHPMLSTIVLHPEAAMPFCLRHYRLLANGEPIVEVKDNHQTRNRWEFAQPVECDELVFEAVDSHGAVPPSVLEIRCYE